MDPYVPAEVAALNDELGELPLDTSVQRLEIDTHLLATEQFIETLRELMEKATRFRNYLRSTDQPFLRHELEDQAERFQRTRSRLG